MKESAFNPLRQAAVEVGGFIEQAMAERAFELGGVEMQEQVREVSASDYGFPRAEGLLFLDSIHPGAGREIMVRAHEIQIAAQQVELAAINSPGRKLKKIGRGMLRMFG